MELLFLILFVAAAVLFGVAAVQLRRGPHMLMALGWVCVTLVWTLQMLPKV